MFRDRLRAAQFGALALILLGWVASISAQASTPVVSTSPASNVLPTGATVASRLDQVWRYVSSEAGGYSDVPNFADPPSLELTAWNLELAALYDIELDRLDRRRTIAWVRIALEQPEQYPLPSELFRLDLTTRALARLGAPPSTDLIVGRLEALRSDWGYSDLPGQPPSWGVVLQAMRVAERVGAEPPTSLVEEVRRRLPEVTAAPVPPLGQAWDLPTIAGVALRVLPRDELRPWRPTRTVRLQTRIDQLEAAGCTGTWTIWEYGLIQEVARANEIALILPDLVPCFAILESANGYLTHPDGTQDGQNDLVGTYLAAQLGRRAPPRLVEMISTAAGPAGWFEVLRPVSPNSTYQGIALDHALGRTERDGFVGRIAERWLEQLHLLLATPAQLREQLPDGENVLLLAREMDLPIQDSLSAELASTMAQAVAEGWTVGERIYLLRYATILEMDIPDALGNSIQPELLTTPNPTIRDLRNVVFLLDARPTAESRALVTDAAEALALGPNLYAGLSDVVDVPRVPRLDATMTAMYGLGRLEQDGSVALEPFLDSQAIWALPPTGTQAAPFNNVETFFNGFVLGGQIDTKGWLP